MNRYLKSAVTCLIVSSLGGCTVPGGQGIAPLVPSAVPAPPPAAPAAPPTATQVAAPAQTQVAAPQGIIAARPAEAPTVQRVEYQMAVSDQPPLHTGMPAYSRGFVSPPCGCPPRAGDTGACTQGCCGSAAPVYPTMPPMSTFGLDAQEFLCDGGDEMPMARAGREDAIIGVGLEDTVVRYETAKGGVFVTPSNRVCIYAPRFAAVRRVSGAVTEGQITGPENYYQPDRVGDVLDSLPTNTVMNPVSPRDREAAEGLDALRNRDVGVPIDNVVSPEMEAQKIALLANLAIVSDGILRDADKPWLAKGAAAAIAWSKDQNVHVAVDNLTPSIAVRDIGAEGFTVYDLPGGRLRVIKLADRDSAHVGDIVTFVLRVDNTGEGPLDNVVLTDNLTTRLEYVEDSQTCTKGAKFDTEMNEGGSLRLTWKFTDNFKVGESAIIRFRCRVR